VIVDACFVKLERTLLFEVCKVLTVVIITFGMSSVMQKCNHLEAIRKFAVLLKRRLEPHMFGTVVPGSTIGPSMSVRKPIFPSVIQTYLKSCNSDDAKQHDLLCSSTPFRSY
jgi:hypothetical protein